jgi:hypothetical protein
MQLESARRRVQTQQACPVTTRSRRSFPTNLVERVGHEKHWDKAADLLALSWTGNHCQVPTLTGKHSEAISIFLRLFGRHAPKMAHVPTRPPL